ncbi:MAG: Kynureninase [Alphaproteobacteria bacterium MarineAlpha2_Bin1]|nr:MAG: Kynureninase [Alphaproteobacteria bacterium MarineAlpha2_Bin1]|tara:strand:+ start:2564 stop:3751 length:1188 start_codon:yes stop_codon:yes gene_type:complete
MERKKQIKINLRYIQQLDKEDIYQDYKNLFQIPRKIIYFGANTLGLMPKKTINSTNIFLNDLSKKGVLGWRDNKWLCINKELGKKISKIIGSAPKQVILSDSTSINLFKLLYSAIKVSKNKGIILTDDKNFPSDYYIISSLAKEYGLKVKIVPREKLIENINRTVSIVTTTQVDYITSETLDLPSLTKQCKKYGAISLLDLSHSVGILPLLLDKWEVDFAVGCTYKYLNGGPGSPAFLYVNNKYLEKTDIIIKGWFGHRRPFEFNNKYTPSKGIEKFLTGTPSIISMKQLEASLEIFNQIDLNKLRKKSFNQTSVLIDLILNNQHTNKIKIISPLEESRGGHIAIEHRNASKLLAYYEKNGLIGDFRPPNVIRFGISPLYNSYNDIWQAAKIINS